MPKLDAVTCAGPVNVYLGLGANTGDTVSAVGEAFRIISKTIFSSARMSSLYVTEPQDVLNQPDFINAACCGIYSGSVFSLLEEIHLIEKNLGRNRSIESRRGPRSIDVDILLFGNFTVSMGKESDGEGKWVRVPHEMLVYRRFALVPVIELNPDLEDPVSGKLLKDIETGLQNQKIRLLK